MGWPRGRPRTCKHGLRLCGRLQKGVVVTTASGSVFRVRPPVMLSAFAAAFLLRSRCVGSDRRPTSVLRLQDGATTEVPADGTSHLSPPVERTELPSGCVEPESVLLGGSIRCRYGGLEVSTGTACVDTAVRMDARGTCDSSAPNTIPHASSCRGLSRGPGRGSGYKLASKKETRSQRSCQAEGGSASLAASVANPGVGRTEMLGFCHRVHGPGPGFLHCRGCVLVPVMCLRLGVPKVTSPSGFPLRFSKRLSTVLLGVTNPTHRQGERIPQDRSHWGEVTLGYDCPVTEELMQPPHVLAFLCPQHRRDPPT